jgi:hypothetical protein
LFSALLIWHTKNQGKMRISSCQWPVVPKKVATDKSSRYGVYQTSWNFWLRLSAQDA